ncbi:methyltransferase domain-containing protein, partial [Klebsiella pneumoniae]|uniref:methyltransferase domain-containing protein n=1 Tax=Klebsiella pneumoniae TaxID=573 RepID=UPI003A8A9A9E
MAKELYKVALNMAGDIHDKTVFDLYSGTGTISQIFSKKAKRVYGIEIVEEAVEKAKDSAKLNEIENCEFIAGDVLEKIDELKDLADIIVLDPPRDGIHPKAIKKIIDIKPEKFIYISCNPVTQ